jgi:hypothetical protein
MALAISGLNAILFVANRGQSAADQGSFRNGDWQTEAPGP